MTGPTAGSRPSALGVTASALAAVGWGFGGIFATLTSASGIVLTFYRTWVGAALLVVLVLASRRRITWSLLRASTIGGILLCGDMTLFFSAVKLTSVAVATVIGALQPALVMLVARPLLRERVQGWTIAWTVPAIAGVGVMVVGAGVPSHHQVVGDLLAAGSLLSWAGYFVASKRVRSKVTALEYTALEHTALEHTALEHTALEYTAGVTIVAALASTVVLLASGDSPAGVRSGDWLWIVLLAVIPSSAHLLMNWAHRYLDISVSSVIGSANPIVAAGAGYAILGQRLDLLQISGGVLAVAAIGVVAGRRGTEPNHPTSDVGTSGSASSSNS